ncbi:MAG TPA: hypothetical protein VM529_15940 [Gemmata sp.]|nr:hypothetical protein [Gemmata sp.]
MPPRKKAAAAAEMSVSESIAVAYGDVGIGDKSCRVAVTIDRRSLGLKAAESMLCGKRLSAVLLARSAGGPDQDSLPGADDDLQLAGVFDSKSFRVSPKAVHATLSFSIENVDLATLGRFAKRHGQLTITEIARIPAEAKARDADADDE